MEFTAERFHFALKSKSPKSPFTIACASSNVPRIAIGKNVFCPRARHLAFLQGRDSAFGIEYENVYVFLAQKPVDCGTARVAARRAEHVDFCAAFRKQIFVQVAHELEREILERKRRTVVEFEQIMRFVELRKRGNARVVEFFIRRIHDFLMVGFGNVVGEDFQELEAHFGVRQALPRRQFSRNVGNRRGNVEAAVGASPSETASENASFLLCPRVLMYSISSLSVLSFL